MPDVRPALLQEREKTHGDFGTNAAIAQELKGALHALSQWDNLDERHQEAIDLICTKIARIMAGDARVADHWNDLAGYAQLASEACDKP